MIVDDLSKVEVVSPILQNGIQSMVGVPAGRNQVIGVFHVGTFRPHHLPRTMHGYCKTLLTAWVSDCLAPPIRQGRCTATATRR